MTFCCRKGTAPERCEMNMTKYVIMYISDAT